MSRPPRFVWVTVATMLVGLLVVGLVALQAKEIADREARRDCARAVASRDDARAMWLYLIDTAHADPERVKTFAAKLDELIPELRCDGGNWVPDRGRDG